MDKVQTKYFRRAKLIAFLLSFCPFVRMVALDGSLASGKATEKSDIDFFITTKSGRIWSCRMLVTVLVQLTGYRRYGHRIAGRICLNRYHTEDFLLIRPKNKKNALDYRHFKIFYAASQNIVTRFFQENRWIERLGYGFTSPLTLPKCQRFLAVLGWPARWVLEVIYDLILNDWGEQKLRAYQMKRILNDPRTKGSSKQQIFISDYELRFHPPKP